MMIIDPKLGNEITYAVQFSACQLLEKSFLCIPLLVMQNLCLKCLFFITKYRRITMHQEHYGRHGYLLCGRVREVSLRYNNQETLLLRTQTYRSVYVV